MITQAAAIRALADGKIIRNDRGEYMLDWGELKYRVPGEREWIKVSYFGDMEGISERYPLTFNEARMKMKYDGCKVSRESDPDCCIYIETLNGKDTFVRKRFDGTGLAKPVFFGPDAFEDMWRVVE